MNAFVSGHRQPAEQHDGNSADRLTHVESGVYNDDFCDRPQGDAGRQEKKDHSTRTEIVVTHQDLRFASERWGDEEGDGRED
jgi:hypothetical protein